MMHFILFFLCNTLTKKRNKKKITSRDIFCLINSDVRRLLNAPSLFRRRSLSADESMGCVRGSSYEEGVAVPPRLLSHRSQREKKKVCGVGLKSCMPAGLLKTDEGFLLEGPWGLQIEDEMWRHEDS